MARHDKNSSDDAEDHGVLDDSVVDTTALDVLGLPTAQVRVDLPRGYEDVDDDDVVDDGPEALSGGAIVLDLPAGADVPAADRAATDDASEEGEAVTEADDAEADEPDADESETDDDEPSDGDPVEPSSANPEEAEQDDAESAEPEAEEDGSESVEPEDEPAEPVVDEESEATGQHGAQPDEAPGAQEELVPGDDVAPEEGDAEERDLPLEAEVGDAPEPTPAAAPQQSAEPVPSADPADTHDAPEAPPMPETPAPASGQTRFVAQSAASTRPGGAERAEQLTSDRLIDQHRSTARPEGAWRGFVHRVSGGLINLGDSRAARERKDLVARIAAPLPGRARFVPVLSRKGGVGKTTVTTLLGMALADARDDRVVAVDANPDRGTLAERIAAQTSRTVRDMVRHHERIRGYADISDLVARDTTRLDVVASDTDPHIADAFDDTDYRTVADVAAQYYSLVLTDTGTGIIHSVMDATLDLADQLVVVAGASVDESRLASETLTWLEAHGREVLVKNAIVIVNQSAPGRSLVRLDEVEAHFASRVRAVVRVPYDERLATGGAIAFHDLLPATRHAARQAAAHVVEGMRTSALHAFGGDR